MSTVDFNLSLREQGWGTWYSCIIFSRSDRVILGLLKRCWISLLYCPRDEPVEETLIILPVLDKAGMKV